MEAGAAADIWARGLPAAAAPASLPLRANGHIVDALWVATEALLRSRRAAAAPGAVVSQAEVRQALQVMQHGGRSDYLVMNELLGSRYEWPSFLPADQKKLGIALMNKTPFADETNTLAPWEKNASKATKGKCKGGLAAWARAAARRREGGGGYGVSGFHGKKDMLLQEMSAYVGDSEEKLAGLRRMFTALTDGGDDGQGSERRRRQRVDAGGKPQSAAGGEDCISHVYLAEVEAPEPEQLTHGAAPVEPERPRRRQPRKTAASSPQLPFSVGDIVGYALHDDGINAVRHQGGRTVIDSESLALATVVDISYNVPAGDPPEIGVRILSTGRVRETTPKRIMSNVQIVAKLVEFLAQTNSKLNLKVDEQSAQVEEAEKRLINDRARLRARELIQRLEQSAGSTDSGSDSDSDSDCGSGSGSNSFWVTHNIVDDEYDDEDPYCSAPRVSGEGRIDRKNYATACESNAAAGAALLAWLQKNCSEWNLDGLITPCMFQFEGQEDLAMFQYSDTATLRETGEQIELTAQFFSRETPAPAPSPAPAPAVVSLCFDGACQPNPGLGGCGSEANFDGNELFQIRCPLGEESTNNVAEYMGLITGLQRLVQLQRNRVARDREGRPRTPGGQQKTPLFLGSSWVVLGNVWLDVFGDSELVIEQMKGERAVNAPHLQVLHTIASGLVEQWTRAGGGRVEFEHIARERNQGADALAKAGVRMPQSGYPFYRPNLGGSSSVTIVGGTGKISASNDVGTQEHYFMIDASYLQSLPDGEELLRRLNPARIGSDFTRPDCGVCSVLQSTQSMTVLGSLSSLQLIVRRWSEHNKDEPIGNQLLTVHNMLVVLNLPVPLHISMHHPEVQRIPDFAIRRKLEDCMPEPYRSHPWWGNRTITLPSWMRS